MSIRTFNAAAKFLTAQGATNDNGTIRLPLEMVTLRVQMEADQTVTAKVMHFDTMKITKVDNANMADVRELFTPYLAK